MKYIINIFKRISTKKVVAQYNDEFEDMFLYAEAPLPITRIKNKSKVIAYRRKRK